MKGEYQYRVVKEFAFNHETGGYVTYGIEVTSDDPLFAPRAIPDVCLSEKELAALARRCNEFQLLPVHLPDVIDDFLAEWLLTPDK